MGYRSHVIIAFEDRLLKRFINEISLNAAHGFIDLNKRISRDDWTLFEFSDVKWYDSYEDVDAYNNFVNSLDESDSYKYEFHRLGEDPDDYEFINSGTSPFNINLVRHLEFDY